MTTWLKLEPFTKEREEIITANNSILRSVLYSDNVDSTIDLFSVLSQSEKDYDWYASYDAVYQYSSLYQEMADSVKSVLWNLLTFWWIDRKEKKERKKTKTR